MREFDPVTGRITLTKTHIASEHGQRLIQLILEIGLNGELSDDELIQLSEWLKSAPQDVPAIRHLHELLGDALADGFISAEERKILHKQIICGILGFVIGVPISYFTFRWVVAEFIVKELTQPPPDVPPVFP